MTGHRKFSELEAGLDANPDYPAVAERVAARLDAEDAARGLNEPPTPSALPTTDATSLGR
jgi:hypothetical protein